MQPSSLPGGTEGATLHPRPAQALPYPRSGTVHPAVFHTFFLSLSLLLSSSHILPVELLGKSNVRSSSCSSRPCCICLSPPSSGPLEGTSPGQGGARKAVRAPREGPGAQSTWGPRGPQPGMSPRLLLGQSARPGGVGWLGRVEWGPPCPPRPASSLPVNSCFPYCLLHIILLPLSVSLAASLCCYCVLVHCSLSSVGAHAETPHPHSPDPAWRPPDPPHILGAQPAAEPLPCSTLPCFHATSLYPMRREAPSQGSKSILVCGVLHDLRTASPAHPRSHGL